ncbi:MAG: YggS family pyridoxal phosphate-dependent enzyme [Methylotenera sp.]
MTSIDNRLQAVQTTIQAIKLHANCSQHVNVLAVSKAKPAAAVREAYLAGQTMFGENYLQEALDKQVQLTDLPIEWHFIGPIQSNKTQLIARHFAWVHSIDRLKIAQRLNEARPANMQPLQVCIQVNISHEESKSGVLPDELSALATAMTKLPRLQLRGLMAIPAPSGDNQQQRAQFRQVRQCYDALVAEGFALDTLSMGMSDDYEMAIEQGATIIRLGSCIFGARN